MKFIDEEKYKNKIGIYQIRNIINNKKYIGQTTDRFIERYWNHLWKLKNNKHENIHLQNSFNAYTENNFVFEVIKCINSNDDIDDLERFYINKYGLDNLYNIQSGGKDHTNKNIKLSEETKLKIGKSNSIALKGKKHTKETKEKMSKIRYGKTQWGKCLLLYENAKFIKILLMQYKSPKIVSEIMNIDYKIVNNIYCNNTYKSVEVYGWNEFYNNKTKQKSLSNEEINLIKKLYNKNLSISEIQRITGFCRKTIRKYK